VLKEFYTSYYPSPVGLLMITFSADGLKKIEYVNKKDIDERECNSIFFEKQGVRDTYNLIYDQLNEYFTGNRAVFDFPILLSGSNFQLKVWDELMNIPYGETYSYYQIAKAIGNPGACQAVGSANKRNPLPIVIPCHRVIGADGSLTGYEGGLWRKRWLIDLEQKYFKKRVLS
jgi:methylated-DNA-[protein]-cysteine S-methyltransferase